MSDMFIKSLDDCATFVAGDNTLLKEILHPDKADLSIRYSLAHAVVPPYTASLRHRLTTAEVYFILSGAGLMHIDDNEATVKAGDTVYIPPHATQWIENTGASPLAFLCIVDPPWREEDEQVF